MSACGPSTPGLTVSNITFVSDIQDSAQKSFICDDDFTTTTITFKYSGDLASWDVELIGATSGQAGSKQTFNYNDPNPKFTEDKATRTITMTYVIGAGTAPLSANAATAEHVAAGVQPQAITVVPLPKQIGTTKLVLSVRTSTGQSAKGEVGSLPVISNCKSVVPGGELAVYDVKFQSDFRATLNGVEQPVICNNTFTPVTVSFRYLGSLAGWTIQFKGQTTGNVSTAQNFTYPGNNYTEDAATKTITVNYAVGAGTAPLNAKPQAIVVVPLPNRIGTTSLILTVRNTNNKSATDIFGGLPVVDNCP